MNNFRANADHALFMTSYAIDRIKSKSRRETGAVSTEMAILVAVLVGIAVFIGTAMVNKATDGGAAIDGATVDVPAPN